MMEAHASLPRAASITHQHLLACVNSAIGQMPATAPLRILDAGCGDGRMLAYLSTSLRALQPHRNLEVYGFDVLDQDVQPKEFLCDALVRLAAQCPGVDWSQRVVATRVGDPWPFADGFFAIVLSNQVLEHVHAPERFFAEHFRVLARGGRGYHLFPLKHYFYEGHLLLPWVHRIRSWELMRAYIHILSALGLGKYRDQHRASGMSRHEFATRHADYVYFWTHYLTEREIVAVTRASGFRTCFRHTGALYAAKLRSVLRLRPKYAYAEGSTLGDALRVKLFRYLSSVTLAVEKQNAY